MAGKHSAGVAGRVSWQRRGEQRKRSATAAALEHNTCSLWRGARPGPAQSSRACIRRARAELERNYLQGYAPKVEAC